METRHLEAPLQGVGAYERAFARLLGPDMAAFAFWKGRTALYAILRALGLGDGDEVILAGFTCVVVANAVRFAGARPVYADITAGGYNLDANSAAHAITPRTRAVIVQHTLGVPAPVEDLLALARRHGLFVIEDCAHALGSALNGQPLGTGGDAAFFSSQWSKPYTTGMGGIAVTRDRALAQRLAKVQQQFSPPGLTAQWVLALQYHLHQRLFTPRLFWLAQGLLRGIGGLGLAVSSSGAGELAGCEPHDLTWQMARPQRAAGVRQLERVSSGICHRRMLSALYDAGLRAAGLPVAERHPETVLLRYPLLVRNKQQLLNAARKARVELGSWFETPLHPVPLGQHADFGYALGQCPNSEAAAERIVNLPLHARVTVKEAERVLAFVLKHAAWAEQCGCLSLRQSTT